LNSIVIPSIARDLESIAEQSLCRLPVPLFHDAVRSNFEALPESSERIAKARKNFDNSIDRILSEHILNGDNQLRREKFWTVDKKCQFERTDFELGYYEITAIG
jgi:hypothetical protein